MASIALGLASVAGGLTSGLLGSSAASKAAKQQETAAQNALKFQQDVYNDQKQNQAPYLQAGQQSLADLMKAIQSGTFGPGSLGPVPTAPGAFTAPTLDEARNSPGYQFTQEQGNKGILQGAAALGGTINGGTLKSLDQFNSGLADTTYGNLFQRALQGYNANLQDYASKLAGFQTGQSAQAQAFSQLLAPAQLGENAVSSLNNTGTIASNTIGNTMTDIGRVQAGGTVGSANAINGAINSGIGGISQSVLLGGLLKSLNGGGGGDPSQSASYLASPASKVGFLAPGEQIA